MNIYNKLGIRFINDFEYNSINNSLKENYKINGNVSFYNPNLHLLTNYFKKTNSLNNTHKLIRLVKKKSRIQSIGFMYKALIKNKKNTYFTNVFVKELPLIAPNNINILFHDRSIISPINKEYNNIIYDKNNYTNIEIFTNYLVSKLQEHYISPSFIKYYGCYLTNMSKFTYDISDIENIPENAILQSNFYNSKNLELNNIDAYLLVTEKADYDIDFIKKTNIVDYNLFISFVFQIFTAIITLNNIFGIKHNDLHLGNIMVMNTKKIFVL